jgi:hypothetical protein
MGQINLNITEEFEKDLENYMKKSGVKNKSEAIRMAVKEAARLLNQSKQTDFLSWVGSGLKAPTKRSPKFKTEDDLWS